MVLVVGFSISAVAIDTPQPDRFRLAVRIVLSLMAGKAAGAFPGGRVGSLTGEVDPLELLRHWEWLERAWRAADRWTLRRLGPRYLWLVAARRPEQNARDDQCCERNGVAGSETRRPLGPVPGHWPSTSLKTAPFGFGARHQTGAGRRYLAR
jgi:hypothetical protein